MNNIMAGDNEDEEEATAEGLSSQEMNIARRTRSHLRMDDFVPNDNLNFPDVDMNLYRNHDSEVNPDYRQFLNQCYSDEIGNGGDTNTDDNDPEYVYNDDVLSHGWRFDLDEVSEFQQDDAVSLERQQQHSDNLRYHQHEQNPTINFSNTNCIQNSNDSQLVELSSTAKQTILCSKSPSKVGKRKIDMFDDPEFARILNQQLRQHIQLLTQTYLLTKNTSNMRKEADETKCHLNSYMKIFKNKTKPSNLLPALELVNNLEAPKDLRSSIRLSWRPLPIPESVKETIQKNPHVFIYSSLLPQVAYSFLPAKLVPKKQKVNFTLNEDKLLAYALNEFKGEASSYAFIASLLMTAKTKTQICNHIKNIKRSPCAGNENNPIVAYFNNGTLPEIDLDGDASVGITHLFKQAENYEESELGEEIDEKKEDTEKEEEKDNSATDLTNMSQLSENKVQIKIECAPNVGSIVDEENEKEAVEHNTVMPLQPQFIDLQNGCLLSSPKPLPPRSPSLEVVDDFQQSDDLMNMNLDDLIAASTTISKSTILSNTSENNNNRNIKNLKLKKSMLNLMSHKFLLSDEMSDLIISEFLRTSQQKLDENQYIQLLQLLTNLMKESKNEGDDKLVHIFREISAFLRRVQSPPELQERIVLFLNLEQATKCGCSISYLHWMRFFEFMQHLELYHDEVDVLEKKLNRLLDALQKEDNHKVKLAVGNLVDKHPFLKREFDSLSLDEKPHPSLFICEEDFDDITEPINFFTNSECEDRLSLYDFEHFNPKLTEEELSYASQSCPCKCHINSDQCANVQPNQHCGRCNLKFVKGRMYLVNKIKPILAEWSYTGMQLTPQKTSPGTKYSSNGGIPLNEWTFEDDRIILEFCRSKVEQNDDTVSFDTSTFEELIAKRKEASAFDGICRKSAGQIVERFNYLMDIYKDENQNASSQSQ